MSYQWISFPSPGGAAQIVPVRVPRFSILYAVADAVQTTVRWYQHRKAVSELSALNDHTLTDIGLHRSEIYAVGGNADSVSTKGRYLR